MTTGPLTQPGQAGGGTNTVFRVTLLRWWVGNSPDPKGLLMCVDDDDFVDRRKNESRVFVLQQKYI
jgi:hypothetical protein